MRYLPALLIAMALSCGAVRAEEWKPLSGTYALTAQSYLDPPADEPPDSHFRVQLDGSAAAELYHAIPGAAATDECTGGMAKSAGQLRCLFFERDRSYECAFSIDLLEQRIEYGIAC